LVGVEDDGGELGLVDGVGGVLGFEAESGVVFVLGVGSAFGVHAVGGVEHDGGLGGEDFHDSAGPGVADAGGQCE
jgi:hypothetical protein